MAKKVFWNLILVVLQIKQHGNSWKLRWVNSTWIVYEKVSFIIYFLISWKLTEVKILTVSLQWLVSSTWSSWFTSDKEGTLTSVTGKMKVNHLGMWNIPFSWQLGLLQAHGKNVLITNMVHTCVFQENHKYVIFWGKIQKAHIATSSKYWSNITSLVLNIKRVHSISDFFRVLETLQMAFSLELIDKFSHWALFNQLSYILFIFFFFYFF